MMLSSKVPEPSTAHGHQSGFGHISQPSGTMEYITSSADTLRSIAVACNTTTTKLMKLNRMSSLTIFPGQNLYVPCQSDDVRSPTYQSEQEEKKNTSPSSDSFDFSFLSPLSPSASTLPERPFKDLVMVSSKPKSDIQPNVDVNSANEVDHGASSTADKRKSFKLSKEPVGGDHNSQKRDSSRSSNDERQRVMSGESTESEPFEEGFLKMDVHYLVTGTSECVKGVMLITPTALMFDPDTEDMVVKRDGCDEYGIMCPMSRINSVAMYNDTARMAPSALSPIKSVSSNAESMHSNSRRSSTLSDTTTEAEAEIHETGDGFEIPDLPVEEHSDTGASCAPASPPKSTWSPVHESSLYEVKGKVPGSAKHVMQVRNTDQGDSSESLAVENKINKESATDGDVEQQMESKTDEFKLENEFPFLHAVVKTVEELVPGYERNQRNAEFKAKRLRPDCDHMYLCIHSRRRMVKTFSMSEDDEKLVLAAVDDRFQGESRFPEYWFQVPRKKSDNLYAFFLQWTVENQNDDAAIQLGFVVPVENAHLDVIDGGDDDKKRIRSHTNSSLEFVEDFFDDSYSFEKEWEIISIQEAKRRSVAIDAIKLAEEDDSLIPELEKPSHLLDENTLLSLCKHLPNRCVGYSWSPVYTTYDHGTSLRTLYRSMANKEAPVVLLVQDSNDRVFGALCSNSLRVSDHYYGTGESFLFTLSPNFEVFKWSGENSFFLKGDTDCLTVGGGKGTFGLWLDGDLYRGCSHPCDTFRNKVLSSEEDFVIQSVEVWMIKDI